MRDDGEDEDRCRGRRESRIEQHRCQRALAERIALSNEEDEGRPKKLGQVCEEVLVVRVEAMLGEIGGLGVVDDVVERSYYWRTADMAKQGAVRVVRLGFIVCCVGRNSDKGPK